MIILLQSVFTALQARRSAVYYVSWLYWHESKRWVKTNLMVSVALPFLSPNFNKDLLVTNHETHVLRLEKEVEVSLFAQSRLTQSLSTYGPQ